MVFFGGTCVFTQIRYDDEKNSALCLVDWFVCFFGGAIGLSETAHGSS